MAVISLTSAKGAPGTTTTALALALIWPRPALLVEADMAGSSAILAGYFHGDIPHDRGLVDLASAFRQGELAEGLRRASIPLEGSNASLVPGLLTPAQAGTMQRLWEPIAVVLRALERTGTDVIVDGGRATAAGAPLPLIRESDLAMVVTGSDLPAIAAARALAATLRNEMAQRGVGEDALSMLMVGEGRPFSAREARQVVGLPVAATMPWDPKNAEVLSLGEPAKSQFQRSSLVRGARTAADSIEALIAKRREMLGHASGRSEQRGVAQRG